MRKRAIARGCDNNRTTTTRVFNIINDRNKGTVASGSTALKLIILEDCNEKEFFL